MEHDPANVARLRLRLGDTVVDCGTLQAEDASGTRSIPPRALEVLLQLAAHPLATVTRDELLDAVWKDSFPTPDALSHAVKELRRALADDARDPRFIATVHGLGYRLLVAPEVLAARPDAAAVADAQSDARAAAVAADAATSADAMGALPTSGPDLAGRPAPARLRNGPGRIRERLLVRSTRAWLRHPATWLSAALATLALLAGAAGLAQLQHPSAPAATLAPLTADLGRESLPALSPDGSAVAYMYAPPGSRDYRIHVRGVGALASRQLSRLQQPGLLEAAPAWSSDGTRVAFFRYPDHAAQDCSLVIADVHAGSEEQLPGCHGHVLQHLSWTADDRALVISAPERDASGRQSVVIHRLELADRTLQPLDYLRAPGMIDVEPRVSPDGQWIAFRRGANPYTDLFVMRMDGTGLRRLTDWALPTRGFTWMPDSRTLAVSVDNGQVALRFVTLDGGPVEDVDASWQQALAGAVYPSAAAQGSAMVFARYNTELQVSGWPVGNAEPAPLPQVASSRSDWDAAVAPVGGSVVFVSDRLGDPALLLASAVPGAPVVRLAQHPGMRPRAPAWSADARSIAYVAQGSGSSHGYVVDVERRTAIRVGTDEESVRAIRFTPDGELVVASNRGGGLSLWLTAPDGGNWRPLYVPGAAVGAVAADGTLFFMREGDARLYSRALAGGPVQIVSDNLSVVESGSWVVQPDGIYAVRVRPSSLLAGQSVDYLPWPGDGAKGWTTALSMPDSLANPRISLSSDSRMLYTSKQGLREADLFMWRWSPRPRRSG
jgi:Tol biopolymer transport system component/DNA-binding winged helix-turn-helix (wHTH) protein